MTRYSWDDLQMSEVRANAAVAVRLVRTRVREALPPDGSLPPTDKLREIAEESAGFVLGFIAQFEGDQYRRFAEHGRVDALGAGHRSRPRSVSRGRRRINPLTLAGRQEIRLRRPRSSLAGQVYDQMIAEGCAPSTIRRHVRDLEVLESLFPDRREWPSGPIDQKHLGAAIAELEAQGEPDAVKWLRRYLQ